MNTMKFIFAPFMAGMMFLSCQYQDEGAQQEDKAPLLGIAAAAGSGKEAAITRFSNSERKLPLPQPIKKWTVLVYMDGDNNLSQFSSDDIKEMMGSGSGGKLNIVVLWDNDPDQDVPGAVKRHGYYYVERSGVTMVKDTGEVNMGDPKTAKDFIAYAADNFPAEHYLWVWWNHGGAVDRVSVMRGICWDDSSRGDHLTEAEQKDIMNYFTEKAGKKIDIVGFDACLMATAEIAHQYADSSLYLVASEQSEPGDGWDYSFLSKIKSNPSLSARSVAKHILTYYKNYYLKQDEDDVTMSVLDLSYAASFARSLDDFAAAARSSGVSGATYRTLSKGLAMFGTYNDGEKECYFTKDLYGFFNAVKGSSKVTAAVKKKADICMKRILDKKFVVSEWHGPVWNNKAFGISVTLKHATDIYRQLDFCADTRWDEFLNWAKFPDNDYVF